jgi:hypothetical protein
MRVPAAPTSLPAQKAASRGSIVLTVRTVKEPPSGDGLFQTFVPMRSSKKPKAHRIDSTSSESSTDDRTLSTIRPPPVSAEARLGQEFTSILASSSQEGLRLRFWGRWLEYVPARIGRSSLFDRAANALITGYRSRQGKSGEKLAERSRRQYGDALSLLKEELEDGRISVDTLAATRLLMTVE